MSYAIQGPDWQCVTEAAPWQGRDSQGDMVFDDHMWTLGGWFTPQTPNPRDVWKSPDGKDWTELKSNTIWRKRHEPSCYTFKDSIYLAGGHAEPVNSEVWRLHLPPDFFEAK